MLVALGAVTMASTTALGDHQTKGAWADPPGAQWNTVLLAEHAIHLKTGEILVFEDDGNAEDESPRLWDPSDGSFTEVDLPYRHRLDCGGHAGLDDGTVLVAGGGGEGGAALDLTSLFGFGDPRWTELDDMVSARWYPTCTTLRDGKVLVMAGADDSGSGGYAVIFPEIYDPGHDVWRRISVSPSVHLETPEIQRWYPFMFVVPDSGSANKVFCAGGSGKALDGNCPINTDDCETFMLDVGAKTWTWVDDDPMQWGGSSAVMYEPGKVLKSGGHLSGSVETHIIDLTASTPSWSSSDDMSFGRRRHNLVLLPDGTILAIGGQDKSTVGLEEEEVAVFKTELIDPQVSTPLWSTMADHQYPHARHSVAILMADGRVLAAGGDNFTTGGNDKKAEIFSPPYLYVDDTTPATRPVISTAPTSVGYGDSFDVVMPDDSETIDLVSFLRLGGVTHSFDQNQRFVELTYTQDGDTLDVTAPLNGSYAPPGYYMLFIINDSGVPSVAEYVKLN